ncbi:hypothetical protein KCP77_21110 [Salmonella enterica subsp. enterica]|nr:hypothetical protein KCP77_21110 [Salmonella enterica subsp. enterica]
MEKALLRQLDMLPAGEWRVVIFLTISISALKRLDAGERPLRRCKIRSGWLLLALIDHAERVGC